MSGDATHFRRALERLAGTNSLDFMESSEMTETPNTPAELDVRVIPPREKHPTIFRTFEALDVGESFVLVNDHDPFPLRHQLEAERTGQFGWEYLEQGPVVWRVEISRKAAA